MQAILVFRLFLSTLLALEGIRQLDFFVGDQKSTALKSFQLIASAEVALEIERSQRAQRANIASLE